MKFVTEEDRMLGGTLETNEGTFEVADSVPFYGPGEGEFSSWRFHIPTGYQRASVTYYYDYTRVKFLLSFSIMR